MKITPGENISHKMAKMLAETVWSTGGDDLAQSKNSRKKYMYIYIIRHNTIGDIKVDVDSEQTVMRRGVTLRITVSFTGRISV